MKKIFKLNKLLEYRQTETCNEITGCPKYEGYIPKSLGHEVCKYCGQIDYYH